MNSFEGRLKQKEFKGYPQSVFFLGFLALLAGMTGILMPVIIIKVLLLGVCPFLLFLAFDDWVNRDNWLVKSALLYGQDLMKKPTYSKTEKRIYQNECHLHSFIGDYGIVHKENAVSVGFVWNGCRNIYFGAAEHSSEHKNRVAIQRVLSQYSNICVEYHFIRRKDGRLAKTYLDYHKATYKNPPKIIAEIKEKIAEDYGSTARSNSVFVVITVQDEPGFSLSNLLSGSSKKPTRWKKHYAQALEVFEKVKGQFNGAKLLSSEGFMSVYQMTANPYADVYSVEPRHALGGQIAFKKPSIDEENQILEYDGRFYAVCLYQNYPTVDQGWFRHISNAGVDIHAVSIQFPKRLDAAINKLSKSDDDEAAGISKTRGKDMLLAKLTSSAQFKKYVVGNRLPVADNAFVITFSSDKLSDVKYFRDKMSAQTTSHEGLLRYDNDLQMAMFRTRLPGEGAYSSFRREDHADTLCAMLPFTTFDPGETKRPESIRLSHYGHLVGYAPSTVEVAHELVVAETNGGKDTFFGAKLVDTHHLIRYDILELGNSYQGFIEAIGGEYCRSSEQVINPLSPYSEINQAEGKTEKETKTLRANLLNAQVQILLPIFKDFEATKFIRLEELVLGKLIERVYSNPISGKDAPILPDLLEYFDHDNVGSDEEKAVSVQLQTDLEVFLGTLVGQRFLEDGQFNICPVANAIDFHGLKGELLQYFLSFTATRLASNAMAMNQRAQITFNEYGVMLAQAPAAITQATLIIDRMGRKEGTGLTRITQGFKEIEKVDSEAVNSIQNFSLLARKDQHEYIGKRLQMPPSAIVEWEQFVSPRTTKGLKYREGFLFESGLWTKCHLRFPKLHLQLMNTRPEDKEIRDLAYSKTKDPYKRIQLIEDGIAQREKENEKIDQTVHGNTANNFLI